MADAQYIWMEGRKKGREKRNSYGKLVTPVCTDFVVLEYGCVRFEGRGRKPQYNSTGLRALYLPSMPSEHFSVEHKWEVHTAGKREPFWLTEEQIQPYLVLLYFALLHFTDVALFTI